MPETYLQQRGDDEPPTRRLPRPLRDVPSKHGQHDVGNNNKSLTTASWTSPLELPPLMSRTSPKAASIGKSSQCPSMRAALIVCDVERIHQRFCLELKDGNDAHSILFRNSTRLPSCHFVQDEGSNWRLDLTLEVNRKICRDRRVQQTWENVCEYMKTPS